MWIQAEYQGEGHWFHQELGFVLEDIPFRLQAFHQFADAAGIEPFSFRQDTHLQGFHLNLQAPLKRPIHRPHGTGRFDMLYVEGDNPFYRQPEALREAADDGVPQHYLDHFASIPRLLAQVRGGLVPADNKFTLVHVEAIHLGLREETYLMHAMVGAR